MSNYNNSSSATTESIAFTNATAGNETGDLFGEVGHHDDHHHEDHKEFEVFHFEFEHVQIPFIITIWIIVASIAKVGFHMLPRISKTVPESCLLTILGVIIGGFIFYSSQGQAPASLTPRLFFMFLLPPIMLDAGYYMPNRLFFNNIGTILIMAIFGTIFNAVGIGALLYSCGLSGIFGDNPPNILETFLFSSLISAVDPVAVIAVFEEIHVDEVLFIVVFGESLLNDAVTVVLYNMFNSYVDIGLENIKPVDFGKGIASFFVVAVGGTAIGILWGFILSFVTKFTHHLNILEPLLVITFSYVAYLNAEMFHMSGILAIIFFGISAQSYVERNISCNSQVTLKYSLKMLSTCSETIIFVFLGLETIHDKHVFNWPYIWLTVLFCLLVRSMGVLILINIVNRYRIHKLDWVDQFVLSYGGLRGAVAVVLAFLIDRDRPHSQMFTTTTLFVFYWTVFIHGITIKPLVKLLHVKTSIDPEPGLTEKIFDEVIDHATAAMEEILGQFGYLRAQDVFHHFESRYIKPVLLFDHNCPDGNILSVYEELSDKETSQFSKTHPKLFTALLSSATMDDLEALSVRDINNILNNLVKKELKDFHKRKVTKNVVETWKSNAIIKKGQSVRKDQLKIKKAQEESAHIFQVHQEHGSPELDDKNDVLVIVTPIQHPYSQKNEAFQMEEDFDVEDGQPSFESFRQRNQFNNRKGKSNSFDDGTDEFDN